MRLSLKQFPAKRVLHRLDALLTADVLTFDLPAVAAELACRIATSKKASESSGMWEWPSISEPLTGAAVRALHASVRWRNKIPDAENIGRDV